MDIYRLAEDETLLSYDAPGSTQNWRVTGSEDEATVFALILSTVPAFDVRGNPFIDARAKHIGGGVWDVEVRYGPIPPLATGLSIWDIDTTGGREKKYQSLDTRNKKLSTYATDNGWSLGDFFGAIAVDERGPQGVDVAVPKLTLVGKRKYRTLDGGPGSGPLLPSDYTASLESITATVNADAFSITWWGQTLDFGAGELLFLGGVVTVATEYELEIDHKFEASRDRTAANGNAVQLVGFTGTVDKPGWDYAWFFYQRAATGNLSTQVPLQYQTEKVYPDGDFSVFIL
jgi:hypothetical protein